MITLGIDLAGSEKKDTGYCALNLIATNYKEKNVIKLIDIGTVDADKKIIALAKIYKPDIIAIDAPLSLPLGRKSLEDRENIHFRQCDLELRRRGIRFFPITLGPMRMLTKRGINLKSLFISKGYDVIEVFPGATYDILGIKRKNSEIIRDWIKKITGRKRLRKMSQDELDGFTCAFTGLLYLTGRAEVIGNAEEGLMVIPNQNAQDRIRRIKMKN